MNERNGEPHSYGRIPSAVRRINSTCHDGCLQNYPVLDADVWRVGYVHISKAGGTSVLRALDNAGSAACNVMTAGVPSICPCVGAHAQSDCLRRVAVVAGERPFVELKRMVKPASAVNWLWAATVREPRSWFYSAVAQWCTATNAGRSSKRCRRGTTAADLLAASWFAPSPRPARSSNHTEVDYFLPYFWTDNFQTHWLGSVFLEEHWLVCSLERLNTTIAAIDAVLRSAEIAAEIAAEGTPDQPERQQKHERKASQPLKYTHSHRTPDRWRQATRIEETVRWEELRRFALLDEGLYMRVTASGGCIAHTSSAWLRALLNLTIAPALWL
jgi:hypothetical protein